jgi:signal transduction histidine kinase
VRRWSIGSRLAVWTAQDLVEDAQVLGMRCKTTADAEISQGIVVCADQSYVRQALLNLLDNAIKYNVESGAISVSLKKSGALALFRIANTGPEIPKDREARIFVRFYRGDPSRISGVFGSGLGLSICRDCFGTRREHLAGTQGTGMDGVYPGSAMS